MRSVRGIGVTAVVAAACFVVPGLVTAEIGGKPTNDLKRCDFFSRPCGPPIVVAEGRQLGEKREIVGLKTGWGSCLSFESVDGSDLRSQPCDEDVTPRPKEPIRLELVSEQRGQSNTTEVGGVLRPDVAAVKLVYRRGGERKAHSAIVGQLDRRLARRIGFKGRVGVFDLVIRGVGGDYRRARLKAYDADGEVLPSRSSRR